MKPHRLLFLALIGSTALGQSPFIFTRGIVNAASFAPAGVPAGPLARGSILTIFGSGLGPATGVQVSAFPIGTTLQGVSVSVTQGSTQIAALPLYVSAGQLNVLLPSNAPLGAASVRVTYNGATSNAAPVQIVNTSLALFSIAGGRGPGVLTNFVTQTDQPVNSTQASATPGQVITAYGTGLGPISAPDNEAPPAGSPTTPVNVYVGGQAATVLYSGRSPCCSGLDQVVFQVPANAPTGCWVPVYAAAGGVTSNFVTMAIDANGAACSEPNNALAAKFLEGGKIGALTLFRASTHEDVGTISPVDISADVFNLDAANVSANPFDYSTLFSQPPAGTCNLSLTAGDVLGGIVPVASPAYVPQRLDAGQQFTLAGSQGSQNFTVTTSQPPVPAISQLGASAPGFSSELVLNPGSYTLSSTGGADVQSFHVQLSIPQPFQWTNRDQLSTIDRTQPLTLTWSGLASSQEMLIYGGDVDLPTNSSAMFYCIAPAGATSFTVPASVLATIPATRANVLRSKSAVYLGSIAPANGVAFSAPGLDAGSAVTGYLFGKTVVFQ